jgi:hypothetical protein
MIYIIWWRTHTHTHTHQLNVAVGVKTSKLRVLMPDNRDISPNPSILKYDNRILTVQQHLVGKDFLVIEASRSHSDTPHSVGLIWTSDQLERRDLTTHNTHNRRPAMPPAGFEPAIPTSERPQTHALDRAATGTGTPTDYRPQILLKLPVLEP